MKTFWKFMPRLPYSFSLRKMIEHCVFVNDAEMFHAYFPAGRVAANGFPTAKLKLTLENFDVDCFIENQFTLVSEKMRRAMALGPSDVQYFDVDASQSSPLPQSKNYQIMHILATEDVAELPNSDYMCHHCPDGTVEIGSPYTVAFRPDADPTHEIFRDQTFKLIYCTDEFALRVLQAGCTGIRFIDPSHSNQGPSTWFRTIRGVEEEGKWDPFRKKLSTKLIREIP